MAEALEDFTGGVAEPVDLVAGKYSEDQTARDDLFRVMKKECENKALMAAAIPVSCVLVDFERLGDGLSCGAKVPG